MLNGYGATILDGVWLTLQLSLLSMAVAIALGLFGASCRLSPLKWLALLGEAYAMVNRIAPLLGYEDYIDINPFVAGVGTLGFIYGAYLSETFRGAFMSIPKGQGEAGMAYGMSPLRVFWRILVPQMIRLAIPGFTNNWLVLIKATALISLVGLQDMMARAKSAGDATHEPFTYILAAAAIYLAITSVSLLVLRYLERRYSAGVKAMEI